MDQALHGVYLKHLREDEADRETGAQDAVVILQSLTEAQPLRAEL